MEYKEIEFKKVKTYKVTRDVKLALLDWVIVTDWKAPEVPAKNAIKSEEVLILWMTNLTQKDLEELSETDYEKVLNKINNIATVPTIAPLEK